MKIICFFCLLLFIGVFYNLWVLLESWLLFYEGMIIFGIWCDVVLFLLSRWCQQWSKAGEKIKKQCSVEAKHLSSFFFCFCVFQKIEVVLVFWCCFTKAKNAHVCILVVLCIFCQEFCCTRELVNMILDAIESVEAFNGIDGRL